MPDNKEAGADKPAVPAETDAPPASHPVRENNERDKGTMLVSRTFWIAGLLCILIWAALAYVFGLL